MSETETRQCGKGSLLCGVSWERRGTNDERRKRPHCCRDCAFANPLQYDRRILRICVNTPKAQGMLAIVDPSGVCPRFREPPAEVVRGIPPECEDKDIRYISLTRGQFAVVDAADFEWLTKYRWHALWSGDIFYASRKEHGSSIRMHREIMRPPEGMVVHHVNGNGLDNRRANLCVCTQPENIRNIGPRVGSSRFKGIWFDRANNKWCAGITVGCTTTNLGRFESEVEAAKARDRKVFELWGPFAYLNFPDDFRGKSDKAKGQRQENEAEPTTP